MTAPSHPLPSQPVPVGPPAPHPGDCYRLVVPNAARASRIARDFVAGLLRVSDHDGLVDDGRLCVAELVTNAHRHTRTEVIRVDAVVGRGRATVYVTDDRPLALPVPAPRRTEFERCGGRGLLLLEQLTYAWGIALYEGTSATEGNGHKAVWFTLAAQPPPLRSAAASR